MNSVAIGALPKDALREGLWPRTLEELRAFVGLGPKTVTRPTDLSVGLDSVFSQIARITDKGFLVAIEKRTDEEFRATVRNLFNDYARVMRAQADLLQVVLGNDVERTERLIDESLCELEADFRQQGLQRFGADVSEQAIFTVWTLRRTAAHIWKLHEPEPSHLTPEIKIALEDLNSSFALYSAWAQFHLGCLHAAVRFERGIYPDVLPAILDGLRAMVNANAYARQIVEILVPTSDDVELAPYQWDEEDEELMQSSMRDLESDQV